jgi:hypothetical protein
MHWHALDDLGRADHSYAYPARDEKKLMRAAKDKKIND